jgi:hypothetical protein
MAAGGQRGEVVPYGSAYGVDHVVAQEALKHAAIVMLDHAMLALAELHLTDELKDVYAEHVRDSSAREYLLRCAQAGSEQEWAVGDLPEIYSVRYRTYAFLKDWIVTLTVVGWKLAQQRAQPLTNVAEELALHLIIQDAIAALDMIASDEATQEAASEALRDLYQDAYEDNDFLDLYSLDDSDEVADLDADGQLGMTDLRFRSWFVPFGSGVDRGVPHPFVLDSDP